MRGVWELMEGVGAVCRIRGTEREGRRLDWWRWEWEMGEWKCGEGVYGLAGGLGLFLGFVQGWTIRLRHGQRFLWGQSVQLQKLNQGVVLGCCATSTEGCSMGTKWWRTITMIAW